MKEVDRVIKERCDPEYQALLRGILLRNSRARWPVDKCLDFMRKLGQSQRCDQISSIGPTLPWTTGPLTAAQIEEGRKRKHEEFERDNIVESVDTKSDDGESGNANIVTPAAPDPLRPALEQTLSN